MNTGTNPDAFSRLYDRDYYLSDCEGHREFLRSYGRKPSKRLAKCIDLLNAQPGECIVDLGCGRGEVSLHAARCGAHVIAVDASQHALNLFHEAIHEWRTHTQRGR